MVAPVEVGANGTELRVGNGLLKHQQIIDQYAVGKVRLTTLEQWVQGRDTRPTD